MKINDLFEGKSTKEQAGYIPRPKNGEKCINCTMWRDPNKCSAVAGDISPNGWCEWYAGGAYGKRGKRVNEAEGLGLTIFDIDETLMRTTAKIKVVKDGKVIKSLSNQEFNNYKLQPGEQFDFGEFRNAEKFRKESEPIGPMIAKLKAILQNAGNSKVIMLTARADFDDKETFLDTFRDLGIDMSRVHVHRAGNLPGSPAESKAVWIRKYLDTGKYSRVRLYDDSMGNIRMFNALAKEYPNVKFFPYLVTHEGGIKTVREKKVVSYENENSAKIKYLTPNFEQEWEEAERYSEFSKLGKKAWIKLAASGKAVTIRSAKDINNTDAADPSSFKLLDKWKQSRALDQLKSGTVEMPIIALYPDGYKELIGGNTRLTAMMIQNGEATVWIFKVPDEVAELAEQLEEDGRIVKGVNTTVDVGPDEIKRQAAKFGNTVDRDGYPPFLRTDGGNQEIKYTAREWAIISGGHVLEDTQPKKPGDLYVQLENFADGKKPGRKGLAKRMGVNTKASVSSLRKTAKNSSGEKARMAHWLANMKSGRKKK